jgi:molybdate transport system substrate-binding protein
VATPLAPRIIGKRADTALTGGRPAATLRAGSRAACGPRLAFGAVHWSLAAPRLFADDATPLVATVDRSAMARVVSLLIAAGLSLVVQAQPAEVHVMTSGAFTAAHLALAPVFERRTGHRVITDATSMGTGDTSIEARLARGEPADVVIVDGDALDRFAARQLVAPGTRVDLARSAIGMAVRKGAPKPDIATVDALTRALLAAQSIAYSASVSGNYLSTELFQRLGIADRVLPKSRRVVGERVAAVVARGDAEIGFQQISELLPEPGVDYVGPLPGPVQRVSTFAAAIGGRARRPDLARLYVAFLASADAADAIAKTALEPAGHRVPVPVGD